jgi:hypothetical protein
MTIKPPLYLFDPDQTHDLLWSERIDGRISALLSNSFQNHGPFSGSSLPVVLVDRYIPGGDSIPWASEWTTTYFEFLKPLSRTHLLTDGEINGSAYGFTPEYQANLPGTLNLKAAWPETVKVKVSKGQTGLISWLERAHSETHAGQYCPQVSNQIQVWMRRHKVITAFEDLEVELDCRLWLHNSVVLQNATLEGISNAQRRLFNYADLDNVLEDCYGQFNISECKVLTRCEAVATTKWTSAWGFHVEGSQNYDPRIDFGNPFFQSVPSQYSFASLVYAVPPKRNDKPLFTTETPRTDLGRPLQLIASISDNDVFFSLVIFDDNHFIRWRQTSDLPFGFSPQTESTAMQTALNLPISIPDIDLVEFSFQTFINDSKLTDYWNYTDAGQYKTIAKPAYPPLYRSQQVFNDVFSLVAKRLDGTTIDKRLDKFSVYQITLPTEPVYLYFYRNDRSGPSGSYLSNIYGLAPDYSEIDAEIDSSYEFNLPGEFNYPTYRIYSYWYAPRERRETMVTKIREFELGSLAGETRRRNKVTMGENCLSILFGDGENPDLFGEGMTVLFQNDLTLFQFYYEEMLYDFPWYQELGRASSEGVINYFEHFTYERKLNVRLSVNYDTGVISQTTSHQANLLHYQIGSIYGGRYPDPDPPWPGAFDISQSFTLNRSLRLTPKDSPKYIIRQLDKNTWKYVYSFPTKEQMLLLIEPTPGFFLCDPNPDPLQNRNTDPQPNNPNNTEWIGDIMPDSLRVKEIHAALQADKYANDDFDAQKARVANLGWLIDKMSNVLGLHFASDGEMLKVRATEHKKDGDTIPEQWQIGQWGKNNWIAKKSTGQNVAVNGVGYAYEVRSNGFTTDKFTGQPTAIEEGGWVLCNSLIQLLETKFDDDDRAFGLQDLGANVIPRSDKTGFIAYEGMHSLLIEIAYMLSSLSGNISRSEVLNMKTVAILQELLASQGLPVELKTLPATVAGQSVQIPYPGLSSDSPSIVDFMFWILSNLSPLVSAQLAYKNDEEQKL